MSPLTTDMRTGSPESGSRSLTMAETRLYWRASLSLRGLDGSMPRQAAWRWLSFVARSGSTNRLRRSAERTFTSIGFAGLFRGLGRAGELAEFRGETTDAVGGDIRSPGIGEMKRSRSDSEPR